MLRLIVEAPQFWIEDLSEPAWRGKFSSNVCVIWRFSCHASRGRGLLAASHLCFSCGAAHPGEKGPPLLCQVDSMIPLSPATLFHPLSSVSFTRPPPVNSHCSGLKLYPRGESYTQQRHCGTKLPNVSQRSMSFSTMTRRFGRSPSVTFHPVGCRQRVGIPRRPC